LDFKVRDEIDATDFAFTNTLTVVYRTNPSPFGLQPGQTTFYGFRYTEGIDDYYGYLEVERGSVNVNQIVFNSNANEGLIVFQAAVTPTPGGTVPEPGSLALLAAGALGVAAIRRRCHSERAELAAA
jgi:hypothetical protein